MSLRTRTAYTVSVNKACRNCNWIFQLLEPHGVNFELQGCYRPQFERLALTSCLLSWQLRKQDVELVLSDESGSPLAGARIEVNQIKRSFPFGCVSGPRNIRSKV